MANLKVLNYIILFVISLLVFGVYFAYDSVGALAPALKNAGLSTTGRGKKDTILHHIFLDVGLLYSLYSLPACATGAIGGMLIDRLGVIPCGLTFLVLTCVGTLISALATPTRLYSAEHPHNQVAFSEQPFPNVATTMAWFILGRMLLGGSGEVLYAIQGRMLLAIFPPQSLSIAFSIVFALGVVGSARVMSVVARSSLQHFQFTQPAPDDCRACEYFSCELGGIYVGGFRRALNLTFPFNLQGVRSLPVHVRHLLGTTALPSPVSC